MVAMVSLCWKIHLAVMFWALEMSPNEEFPSLLVYLPECDSCTLTSLVDLEQMDDSLGRLEKQMQNITTGSGSLYRLSRLKANMSEIKVQLMQVSDLKESLPKEKNIPASVIFISHTPIFLRIQCTSQLPCLCRFGSAATALLWHIWIQRWNSWKQMWMSSEMSSFSWLTRYLQWIFLC